MVKQGKWAGGSRTEYGVVQDGFSGKVTWTRDLTEERSHMITGKRVLGRRNSRCTGLRATAC